MPVYQNRQGKGLWIVFKYVNGELDTGSYSGSYARKPPARTYNTVGHAKAQWNRFIKDGYGSRVAEIALGENGVPVISWCDDEWTPNVEMCKFSKFGKTCRLKKDHAGIHTTNSRTPLHA